MKVNWLAAATMTIAASLGLTFAANAQSPTYTIADFTQPEAPPTPQPEATIQPMRSAVPPAPMVENGAPAAAAANGNCPQCAEAAADRHEPFIVVTDAASAPRLREQLGDAVTLVY